MEYSTYRTSDGDGSERAGAERLSRLKYIDASPRAQRAVWRPWELLEVERFARWLEKAEAAVAAGGPSHAAAPLDRLADAADPLGTLSTEELARRMGASAALRLLASPRAAPEVVAEGVDPTSATPATNPRAAAFAGSAFAEGLFASLATKWTAAGLDELLRAIDIAAAMYPNLKPKYCDNGTHEFVRELRRVLKQRWGTDELTPTDAACLLDLHLITHVGESLRTRVRM